MLKTGTDFEYGGDAAAETEIERPFSRPAARGKNGTSEGIRNGGIVSESPDMAQPRWLNAQSVPILASSAEFVAVASAVFAAVAIYHRLVFHYLPSVPFYLVSAALLTALFVAPSILARDYSIKRMLLPKEQLRSVFFRWNVAYSLFVFALFMLEATDFYSRGSIVAQYAAGLAAAMLVRLAAARITANGLRSGRLSGKRVLIVGDTTLVNQALRPLQRAGQGADVVRIVRLRATAEDRRSLSAIRKAARESAPDDILLALPWSESRRIEAIVDSLAPLPATVHLVPDPAWSWTQNPVLARVGNSYTIRLSRAPLTLRDRFLKRAFDLTAASALLIAAAPVFALIALLIKLDSPGPVLFRQRRHGFNRHEFRVFKFRTMTTLDDGDVIPQAKRHDARVTRIGQLLRATNLDELPQLLNVIAGDMSLVGPRPHAVAHNSEYEKRLQLYARRHKVKPGITGWAQVKGLRGETDTIEKMQARIEHDLFYIDHWSLLLDIRILVMTPFSVRSYGNAY